MKKVLMINGSPRKKNTYGFLVQIGEILTRRGFESEILNLSEYEIKPCSGCDDVCIHNHGCSEKNDDMAALMQRILDSDGLVLSSPVYLRGVTSTFKAFADRTNAWFHNPETAGKPALLVATTESTGVKETIQFLDSLATGFGARKGGSITRVGKAMATPIREDELSKFITLLEQDPGEYSPAMNELVIFVVQKLLAQRFEGENLKYWGGKDWLDKNYYYPCRINPAKNLFSMLMHKVIGNSMKG